MNPDLCFSADDIAAITGGTWEKEPASGAVFRDVCDDSRRVGPGALFVAIRGELTDGHRYLAAAAGAGAGAVCVEAGADLGTEAAGALSSSATGILRVSDTLRAFQLLARAHRRRFPELALVGITGSCGKTSTKEMIASVLEAAFPGQVLKTEGNTNNHFGVPRNLLRLQALHRAAVIEMGSNHPGEIALLAELAEPTVGVVSNIGRAHLEYFGDLRGVAGEKGDLLAGTAEDGPVVLPAEAAHADILRAKAGSRRVLSFGTGPDVDVRVAYEGPVGEGEYGVRIAFERGGEARRFTWYQGGAHQALNAGAAAAVGVLFGLSGDVIVSGLRACRLPGMRMQVTEIGGVRWFNDAYNANPDSMEAGIRWFADATRDAVPDRRLLVLGDMLELGADGEKLHGDLLERAREWVPGVRIVGVGPLMCRAAAALGFEGFPDATSASGFLAVSVGSGDCVLLKGSRGIRLETLLPPAD